MATKQKQWQEEALLILEFFSQSVPVLHHARKPEKQWRLEGLSFLRSLLYEVQMDIAPTQNSWAELVGVEYACETHLQSQDSIRQGVWGLQMDISALLLSLVWETSKQNGLKKMSLFSACSLNANFHSGSDSLTLPSFLYNTTLILF